MSAPAEREIQRLRVKVEQAHAEVQKLEAAKVNNLEYEMQRRETLCAWQTHLAITHVDLLDLELKQQSADPANRRQTAQARRLHVRQLAQQTHGELAIVSAQLERCVQHEQAMKADIDRLEGRGGLLHRVMRSKKIAYADFIDAVHATGNAQGKEAYLKAKRDGLLALGEVYGAAARGSVELLAPPAYDNSLRQAAPWELGLLEAEYQALEGQRASADPRSPSVREDLSFWAAEYAALAEREEIEHQAAEGSSRFEPGDRRKSHNSEQELEQIRLAAAFFNHEAKERTSEEHAEASAGSSAGPSHPTHRAPRPRLTLDTRDPKQRPIHEDDSQGRSFISRFSAALNSGIDPQAATHIDWSNLPASATTPLQSLRDFLVPADTEVLRPEGRSNRHVRVFRPAE